MIYKRCDDMKRCHCKEFDRNLMKQALVTHQGSARECPDENQVDVDLDPSAVCLLRKRNKDTVPECC